MAFQGDAFQNDAFQIEGGTSASAGVASGTGAASNASARVSPSAGSAAGTGSAHDATVSTVVVATAGVAAGTGTAGNAAAHVRPGAGAATGAGASHDATVSTGSNVTVSPTTAAGTGAASAARPDIDVNASIAAGTGASHGATVSTGGDVAVDAGVAAGTGAAYNATTEIEVVAQAASGAGSAGNAAGTAPVAHPSVAAGYGSASDASVSFPPTGGSGGSEGIGSSVVQIIIDGVDYGFLAHFPTCRFESLVNGQPGRGYVRLRDDDRTLSFTGGETVLVKINGQNVWRGFVAQYKRVYIAPALNIDDFGLTRFIDLECTDINILFVKRIVFNQSDPDNVYGTLFGPGTPDRTAIAALLANFLDLSGDGLNTTALVEEVADINVDQDARAWSGSYTWGQAMASIAMLPASIYYIDPDKNFVYTDVDTPNAPFGLSDTPNGTTTRGYREMEILKDGTVLANDVLAWGMGYGSQTPVFVREQDATSIATHGVWQRGEVKPGIYKQATIDRVAESIVYGSPSSKRGAKDDRLSVALATYEPGLRVAQKVTFTSNVFGFTDVIPVRKMVVTFEVPDKPRYDLVLSHEIDPPWSFIDPFFLSLPGLPVPPVPPLPPPPCLNPVTVCHPVNPDPTTQWSAAWDFVEQVDFGNTDALMGTEAPTSNGFLAVGSFEGPGDFTNSRTWEYMKIITSGFPVLNIVAGEGDIYYEFQATYDDIEWLYSGGGGGTGTYNGIFEQGGLWIEFSGTGRFFRLDFGPLSAGAAISVKTQSANGGGADLNNTLTGLSALNQNEFYSVRIRLNSSVSPNFQFKIWETGTTEPASYSGYNAVVPTTAMEELWFYAMSTSGANIAVYNPYFPGATDGTSVIDHQFTRDVRNVFVNDVPLDIAQECVQACNGFPYMEALTVSGTAYTTTFPYIANSLQVRLNGILQREGTDYTETDPAAGSFTLLFTPTGLDSILVYYLVGP